MKLKTENLGKVAITISKDYWDISKDYDKLTIVPYKDSNDAKVNSTFATYISRQPVPAGTMLTNTNYWIPFSSVKEELAIDYKQYKDIINEIVNQANTNSIEAKDTSAGIVLAMNDFTIATNTNINNFKDTVNTNYSNFIDAINNTINSFINNTNISINDFKTNIGKDIASFETTVNDRISAHQEIVQGALDNAIIATTKADEATKAANETTEAAKKVIDDFNDVLDNPSEAIDSFKEIKDFLDGIPADSNLNQIIDGVSNNITNAVNPELENINKKLSYINNTTDDNKPKTRIDADSNHLKLVLFNANGSSQGLNIPAATETTAGVLNASDKKIIDNLPTEYIVTGWTAPIERNSNNIKLLLSAKNMSSNAHSAPSIDVQHVDSSYAGVMSSDDYNLLHKVIVNKADVTLPDQPHVDSKFSSIIVDMGHYSDWYTMSNDLCKSVYAANINIRMFVCTIGTANSPAYIFQTRNNSTSGNNYNTTYQTFYFEGVVRSSKITGCSTIDGSVVGTRYSMGQGDDHGWGIGDGTDYTYDNYGHIYIYDAFNNKKGSISISDATTSDKGLMTTTHVTKLNLVRSAVDSNGNILAIKLPTIPIDKLPISTTISSGIITKDDKIKIDSIDDLNTSVNNLKTQVNTILDNPTEAIDSINEIKDFLEGVEGTNLDTMIDAINSKVGTKINELKNDVDIASNTANNNTTEINSLKTETNSINTKLTPFVVNGSALAKLTTTSTDADIKSALTNPNTNYVLNERDLLNIVNNNYILKNSATGCDIQVEFGGQDYTFVWFTKPIAGAAVSCASVAIHCDTASGTFTCTRAGQSKGIGYQADITTLNSNLNIANENISIINNNAIAAYNLANSKVSKEEGKGLSTNDYTNSDKQKLTEVAQKVTELSIVESAKELLFQDMWKAWGGGIDDATERVEICRGVITGASTGIDLYIESTDIRNTINDKNTQRLIVLCHDIESGFQKPTYSTSWDISFTNNSTIYHVVLNGTTVNSIDFSKPIIILAEELHPYHKNQIHMTYEKAVRVYSKHEFIDKVAACGAVFNYQTEYFELNGITDLTYEDMQAIDNTCKLDDSGVPTNTYWYIRTNYKRQPTSSSMGFNNFSTGNILEVLCIPNNISVQSFSGWLNNTSTKKIVGGTIELSYFKGNMINSLNCPNLEEVKFTKLNYNFDIQYLRSINKESVEYLVDNAANTTDINVTVHPDVYAKLSDTSNTEWHEIWTKAEARKIHFIQLEAAASLSDDIEVSE